MKQVWQKLILISLPLTTFVCLAPITSVKAQITPDNTLGTENSVVNRNLTIRGIPSDQIDGGARRGNNLFHSFQEFSVNAGRGAYFSNPAGVDNILTRVTGNNPSNILGRLGVLGNANLFLINPNGIVFGPNASLDVGGSFFASTASSLIFNNGFEFSAVNPQAPPMLTVNIPIGLRFRDNPGSITNQSIAVDTNNNNNPVGLQVPSGNTLALLGGDVSLDGGRLTAAGGRVELGGLAREGTVGLNVDGNTMNLSFPDGVARAAVSLTNSSNVDVSGGGSGSIAINARNLDLQQSRLNADVRPSPDTPSLRVGDITINATDTITLGQSSQIESTNAVSNAQVMPHNINITTGSLSMMNGGQVGTFTSGQGNAGNVNINARDVSFDGASNGTASGIVSITTTPSSTGNTGNININTGTLSLTNGAGVYANSNGQGSTGSVTINASDRVSLDGQGGSGIFNLLNSSNGMGNSGGIRITTGTLSLTNRAQLSTNSSGMGNAGDVTIDARDLVSFNNGGISALVYPTATGNGGDVSITSRDISLANGAQVNAISNGQGKAGSVILNASDRVSLDGANGIYTSSSTNSRGNNGGISITTGTLSVTNRAQLNTSSSGMGNAGNVTINARDLVSFNNGMVFLTVNDTATGNGGDISITSRDISLANGSVINLSNTGQGNIGNALFTSGSLSLSDGSVLRAIGQGKAGSVTINASDRVSLDGARSGLFTESSNGRGNGGGISITTGTLSITKAAQLGTFTDGRGNAGDVNVNARDTLEFDGAIPNPNTASGIVSVANLNSTGNTGNINIKTGTLSLTNGAGVFTFSNGQGATGSITINASDRVSLDRANGIYAQVNSTNNIGNNGGISITTGTLSINNNAVLNTSINGMGNAGDVTINADHVSLNQSSIYTTANDTATGNSGNVSITSGDISLANGSRIFLNTAGQGNAGNINIKTGTLSLSNGTQVFARSVGQGSTGSVMINANDHVSLDGESSINTSNSTNSRGNNGGISITTGTLSIANGAQLNTSTNGIGNAGDVTINARDRVSFNNNGQISATASQTATGRGGDVSITSGDISLTNGSRILLNTTGQGDAGNAFLTSRSLSLDGSQLTAISRGNSPGNSGAIGNGGNINLQIGDLLLLRNQSLISTSATSDIFAASSGNITINAPLIVAFPSNNDITANASRGSGGQVTIKTQGLFGIAPLSRTELEQRLHTTDPSQLNPSNLPTSDITAISQQSPSLNGRVDINSSYLDTSQSLVKLPENVVDPTTQIAQNPCQHGEGSTFTVTGRGGIPYNPHQTLTSDNVRVGLVTPASSQRIKNGRESIPLTQPTVKKAVPALGWVFNEKGQVVLTAYDPTKTGSQRPWRTPASCPRR